MFERCHQWWATALVGFVATASHPFVQAQSSAATGVWPDRIVLGQSAKLSGTGGTDLGKQYRAGLLLAFNAANQAGGVNGRMLEFKSLDDQNDGEKARANTQQLMKEGVLALVGYMFSSPVRAALPIVKESGIPFIAPYAGIPELSSAGANVFVFRASAADELAAIVRHIDTVTYQDVAMIHYTNQLGEEMRQDVSKRLEEVGRKLIGVVSMPINPKDPNAAAKVAIDSLLGGSAPSTARTCPKVLILGVSGRDAAAAVRAMQAGGCSSTRYFARHVVDIGMLSKELGPAARGIMVTQLVPNPHKDLHTLVRDYRGLQLKRDNGTSRPDFTEFEGFIVGRFVAQALKRCGSQVTRDCFLTAMQTHTLEGPGHYRVRFSGDKRNGTRYVNFVMISSDGRITD